MDLLVNDDNGYWRGRITEIEVGPIIRFVLEESRSVRWDQGCRDWKEDSCVISSLSVPIGTTVATHQHIPWFFLPVSGRAYLLNPGDEIPGFA